MIASFYSRFMRDETPRLAASLAFYTLFAFAPMLLLLISLAGFFGVEHQIALVSQVHNLAGPQAAAAVQSTVSAVRKRADLTSVVGLTSALIWAFSASLLFAELRSALNRIFGVNKKAQEVDSLLHGALLFIRSRLFSLVLVFAFTVVALGSLIVSSYLAFLVREHSVVVVRMINVIISFAVYFVLFAASYKYVPQTKVSYKKAAFGGLITAFLFVIGKELIGIYLGNTAFGSFYGAAGTLVVMLIWVYYSSLIVFAGAQLTVLLIHDRKRSRSLAPSPEI